mmetsp:Transcript_16956/g.44884  ORF Transcript_16956/g.44884 Transcript_16956/m.44884 type:complete len:276 (+) Transcript_16956:156-983(+)
MPAATCSSTGSLRTRKRGDRSCTTAPRTRVLFDSAWSGGAGAAATESLARPRSRVHLAFDSWHAHWEWVGAHSDVSQKLGGPDHGRARTCWKGVAVQLRRLVASSSARTSSTSSSGPRPVRASGNGLPAWPRGSAASSSSSSEASSSSPSPGRAPAPLAPPHAPQPRRATPPLPVSLTGRATPATPPSSSSAGSAASNSTPGGSSSSSSPGRPDEPTSSAEASPARRARSNPESAARAVAMTRLSRGASRARHSPASLWAARGARLGGQQHAGMS